MPTRLRVFVTHPVQYHVPIWRNLAARADLDLKVFYFNDQSVRGGLDREFGVPIAWDVDLLSGYDHAFISRNASLDRHRDMRIPKPLQLLRNERADWIMMSGYTHAFEQQLLVASTLLHTKLLMRAEFSDQSEHPRGVAKQTFRAAYLRAFYSRVSRFCYPGRRAKLHLQRHGVGEERLFFSPYAVDDAFLERQANSVQRDEARRALQIPEDCFTFLLSGKLIPRKDPMGLLDAIERLVPDQRIGLVALGDGQLRAGFEARAQALLGDRFIAPGFVNQSQLSQYFVAADALIMPSRFETWGLVVNEAMHHRLPAIVSDRVGCCEDLIDHGVTGFVYPAGDCVALSARMREMIDHPARAVQMGVAAHSRVNRYTVAAAASGVARAINA